MVVVMVMCISSFFIRIHPIWIFVYTLTGIIAIFLTVLLANTYSVFVASPAFAEIVEHQTYSLWVMRHSVIIMTASIILSLGLIFGKPGDSSPV